MCEVEHDIECNEPVSLNYLYKVSDHLMTHLDKITGNENATIDEDTINKIKKEILLMNVSFEDVNPIQIREILRKIKNPRYYNHVVCIWKLISNKEGIKISEEEKKNIHELFMRFYREYIKLYPGHSFLSYNFVLQKICYILGYDNIAKEFSQLKSKTKMEECEKKWNDLCVAVEPNYSKLF